VPGRGHDGSVLTLSDQQEFVQSSRPWVYVGTDPSRYKWATPFLRHQPWFYSGDGPSPAPLAVRAVYWNPLSNSATEDEFMSAMERSTEFSPLSGLDITLNPLLIYSADIVVFNLDDLYDTPFNSSLNRAVMTRSRIPKAQMWVGLKLESWEFAKPSALFHTLAPHLDLLFTSSTELPVQARHAGFVGKHEQLLDILPYKMGFDARDLYGRASAVARASVYDALRAMLST